MNLSKVVPATLSKAGTTFYEITSYMYNFYFAQKES